jgi:hypothetical protein
VILITTTIKHHFLDALGAGALGDYLADNFRGGYVAATLDRGANFLIERTGVNQGAPGTIVYHLRANMAARAVNAKARAFRSALEAFAGAHVNAAAVRLA